MTTITTRPENRRRSGSEGFAWAETLPACFRSEAFAEDLDGPAEATTAALQAVGQPPRWLALSAALSLGLLPNVAPR